MIPKVKKKLSMSVLSDKQCPFLLLQHHWRHNFKYAQIEMLTARVQELKAEVHSQQQSLTTQQSVILSSMYKDELLSLLSSGRMISDGPITMEGLESFSLSGLITEV